VDTCISGTRGAGVRSISSYDYIRRGETSEKVGCSIGSVWDGTKAAFDGSGHNVKFEGSKWEWEWESIKSDFL